MKTVCYLTLLGLMIVFGIGTSTAAILNVPDDYDTIQDAINAAAVSDTVLAAPGVYQELIDFSGKDITVASEYIFDNDSTIVINTVIDGNFAGTPVTMANGESNDAILIGFTIKNGTGTLYFDQFYVGGGIYLEDTSPTITCNIITGNDAPDGGGGIFSVGGAPVIKCNVIVGNTSVAAYGCGAGMLIKNSETGLIYRNSIQFNTAHHGGGIALKNSHPEVTRNVVCNNTAIGYGGGIRIYDGSNPTIINNTISHNTAYPTMGGGVEVENGSAPVFMNNIVSFSYEGGGFLVIGIGYPDLSYNLFHENTGGDYLNLEPGFSDTTGDPAYFGGNPYDYHLTALSAAIDQGNPDGIYNDPDGTRNDCGAFPYSDGPTTPVVLTNFSAVIGSESVTLTWNTASEIESYGWIVQRRLSNDSYLNVSPIIAAAGTTVEPQDYSYADLTAIEGGTYHYRLKQIDIGGMSSYSDPIEVTVGIAQIENYELHQNYPNPFNPETMISYSLTNAANMRLTIYNPAGQIVAELSGGYQEAGYHNVSWQAKGLPSGTYICRLEVGQQSLTRQLVLIK